MLTLDDLTAPAHHRPEQQGGPDAPGERNGHPMWPPAAAGSTLGLGPGRGGNRGEVMHSNHPLHNPSDREGPTDRRSDAAAGSSGSIPGPPPGLITASVRGREGEAPAEPTSYPVGTSRPPPAVP